MSLLQKPDFCLKWPGAPERETRFFYAETPFCSRVMDNKSFRPVHPAQRRIERYGNDRKRFLCFFDVTEHAQHAHSIAIFYIHAGVLEQDAALTSIFHLEQHFFITIQL